mmetsp:Transcript_10780/g.21627  ORF Transcript_10780/g.21627 Transcript_10780/m.21627 type:complete len:377 (-) Transcript_10780:204-1334(-)
MVVGSSEPTSSRLTHAFAAKQSGAPLEHFAFERRDPGPGDVEIRILYCGVCHSDIHQARSEWVAVGKGSEFPMVPGHEITGRVRRVGAQVAKFKVGDRVGVGCMVDSCQRCTSCHAGEEQYCLNAAVWTYNDRDHDGRQTFGGYATYIVVREEFVLSIPEPLALDTAAPLLCAGITTWSPIVHWNMGAGHRVGVIGLGGLGHMAIKFASARGAHVVLFTRTPSKAEEAKELGASSVVVSTDADAMQAMDCSLDFIIDTAPAIKDMDPYLKTLKVNGVLVLVGIPERNISVCPVKLLDRRRSVSASLIGSIKETQDMLNFCAAKNISCEIERIHIDYINQAWERVLRSDVRYRFVIDILTSVALRSTKASQSRCKVN